ncbi:ABC transporter ATP-binding protein [Sulfobacillus thermosulfidooxidans]|uniref:ABC transporter ATP-binding protein n=1 Tax=Sulfobacillus thermosulfidooxidans TaxID=28034 RepID=UPI0006B4AACF|nr:ABC transporter ATP-binding protein [Sulfobacillus thermosulfidooxidans]
MAPLIELDHINFSRNGQNILQDISWRVEPGQNWALIGANGSGKTTLLNIITGYLWPSSGHVRVLGHEYGHVDLREIRKTIGWVSVSLGDWFFSHHGDNTVLQVVASGRDSSIGVPYRNISDDTKAHATKALEAVRMADKAERVYRLLSQGERQRVLLARAYMASFRLLILDEPCTGLDIPSREMVLDSIEQLAHEGEIALLYVTHHVEELRNTFSHGLLLDHGRILQQGRLDHVITNQTLSDAFGMPIEVQWDHGRPWVKVIHSTYFH